MEASIGGVEGAAGATDAAVEVEVGVAAGGSAGAAGLAGGWGIGDRRHRLHRIRRRILQRSRASATVWQEIAGGVDGGMRHAVTRSLMNSTLPFDLVRADGVPTNLVFVDRQN
jgi:hypothetical protein